MSFGAIISLIVGISIILLLLWGVFGNHHEEWTQKDIDDGDKQYGFMCYKCEKELEDGEGTPRLCSQCEETVKKIMNE